jgi:hypothetical protein
MSETIDHQSEPRDGRPQPRCTTAMVRKYNVKRSCIRCHERKVRCDKDTPCIVCVRSEVQCRYPGPERAKRVKSRSEKGVERSIVAAANPETQRAGSSTHDQATARSRTTPPPIGSAVIGQLTTTRYAPSESEQSGGLLLKEGSSTRYVNEFTFSRVLEKVRDTFFTDGSQSPTGTNVAFGPARRTPVCHRHASQP